MHLLKALERHSFHRRGFQNKRVNCVRPLLWQTHLFLDRQKFKAKNGAFQCVTTVCEPPSLCFGFSSTSLVFSVLLCVQVSTSRPGGENPSYCPECVQHGHQGGADTAKQRGTRKRYSRKHHLHPCHWCMISHFIPHHR